MNTMVKRVVTLVAVMVLVITLFGCSTSGGLSGRYVMVDERVANIDTFEFSGNEVTEYRNGIGVSGTYEIENNKLVVTLSTPFGTKTEQIWPFRESGDSIFLDGVEFRK